MTLSQINELPAAAARLALMECCGSAEWADRLLARRPFQNHGQLFEEAQNVWWELGECAWLEAFSKHPQIGAREPLPAWSSAEQAGMNQAGVATEDAIQKLNREYFDKFGWIFIICATGKTADEMRASIERRLRNTASEEIRLAAAEQAKIMRIRLQRLLET